MVQVGVVRVPSASGIFLTEIFLFPVDYLVIISFTVKLFRCCKIYSHFKNIQTVFNFLGSVGNYFFCCVKMISFARKAKARAETKTREEQTLVATKGEEK